MPEQNATAQNENNTAAASAPAQNASTQSYGTMSPGSIIRNDPDSDVEGQPINVAPNAPLIHSMNTAWMLSNLTAFGGALAKKDIKKAHELLTSDEHLEINDADLQMLEESFKGTLSDNANKEAYQALFQAIDEKRNQPKWKEVLQNLITQAIFLNITCVVEYLGTRPYLSYDEALQGIDNALQRGAKVPDLTIKVNARAALGTLLYCGFLPSLLSDFVLQNQLYKDVVLGYRALEAIKRNQTEEALALIGDATSPVYFGVCDQAGNTLFSLIESSPNRVEYLETIAYGGHRFAGLTLLLMRDSNYGVAVEYKKYLLVAVAKYQAMLKRAQKIEGIGTLVSAIQYGSFYATELPTSSSPHFNAISTFTMWMSLHSATTIVEVEHLNTHQPSFFTFATEYAEFLMLLGDMIKGGAQHERKYRPCQLYDFSVPQNVSSWKDIFKVIGVEAGFNHAHQGGLPTIIQLVSKWLKKASPEEQRNLALHHMRADGMWEVDYDAKEEVFTVTLLDVPVSFSKAELSASLNEDKTLKELVIFKAPAEKWQQAISGFLSKAEQAVIMRTAFAGGVTLLHKAVRLGTEETIKYLVASHADIDACNRKNQTPLEEALVLGRFETAKCLIMLGAKLPKSLEKLDYQSEEALEKSKEFMREMKKTFAITFISFTKKPEGINQETLSLLEASLVKRLEKSFARTNFNLYGRTPAEMMFFLTAQKALFNYFEVIKEKSAQDAILGQHALKVTLEQAEQMYFSLTKAASPTHMPQ